MLSNWGVRRLSLFIGHEWHAHVLCAAVVLIGLIAPVQSTAQTDDTTETRWMGVTPGPHAVGFEVRTTIDPSRRINGADGGTTVRLAIWYPAETRPDKRTAMSFLDYRLLEFANPLSAAERTAFEDGEANALVAWRHIGIVELTVEQARASLHTRGRAVHGATPLKRKWPVVMVLGGQYYLSTTAELLASHGFLVVAPFRVSDQSNEIGTQAFTWYLENSVRDAEWALNQIAAHRNADTGFVSTIGHGGGGIQAMLFAMRNRNVRAVVNIDAGNFSTRSGTREIAFYSPRLMRAPYLYIATAATKKTQDLFGDFEAMTFSERFEVILEEPAIRHHDLSDLGRAVTAPMRLRGQPQGEVQRAYVDVHDMTVRFLRAHALQAPDPAFAAWLRTRNDPGLYTVSIHRGSEPAPTVVRVLATLDKDTPAKLKAARLRDPEAPIFQPDNLLRIVSRAMVAVDLDTADALNDLALELHPESPVFHELRSRALEARGDRTKAAETAAACSAMQAGNWRGTVAINTCKERVSRLAGRL